MHFKIKISSKAIEDIQLASRWYNQQKNELGNHFKISIKNQIEFLSKSPNAFSIKYKNIRCSPVSGFPFLIHYKLIKNKATIQILAIFHTSRNPSIWKKRSESK
ncbi:MAG: type II toxin-antitoxin system RelE/ParE family toxin [Prolixibacteraceae bacterium]|jgi:hypothetical protein|nr:type II toxin-antitoxin system RelE/ParE family toxin [Prolixibacteraceae bacterium]MBT6005252.1 type II toxin-antitoxin system RelE/ParE family toxin [Prolixibacteraceae bacterium]MBT6763770.1 type II toxin-antitoxin system RelE/ParE family toxin [Prolixibacteraceae bacterium]MBT6996860.1 type II toxin-antitoxin system RelE/ParE family toxin [Prolixibacteraceae bacterium]MBT7395459.1 type II toxin-antitoxin system RelE/ParE family toxin [Prolixibacteraceae bacterium]